MVLPATLCVRERANFGRLGSFSFFSYKKDIGIMWDFDKKKMCGVKPHIGIGTMKKMWNLICGKFTAGRNYNLTLNTETEALQITHKSVMPLFYCSSSQAINCSLAIEPDFKSVCMVFKVSIKLS